MLMNTKHFDVVNKNNSECININIVYTNIYHKVFFFSKNYRDK